MTSTPPNVRKLAQYIAARPNADKVMSVFNDLTEYRRLMGRLSDKSRELVDANLLLLHEKVVGE